jgi:hypothetical protein
MRSSSWIVDRGSVVRPGLPVQAVGWGSETPRHGNQHAYLMLAAAVRT